MTDDYEYAVRDALWTLCALVRPDDRLKGSARAIRDGALTALSRIVDEKEET